MNVADVMTSDLVTCRGDDSLNRAAQLMWERRCGTVAVVDGAGKAVGLLTDRDICMAAYTQGRRLDDVAVATAMSRAVRTIPAAAAIEDAEDVMAAHAVRRVIVVGDDGRACGILSIDDIARAGADWDGKGEIDLEQVALTLGEISRRSAGPDDETPDEQTPETDVRDLVRNSLSALRTLRDEIRVDLNLAGKEVRDRWRKLESRLRAGETRARDARLDAARNLTGLIENAKQFRKRLRDKPADAPAPRVH
jgi:CBS domain-containing protein